MKKVSAKSIMAVKVTVKEIEAEVESARKKLVGIREEPGCRQKIDKYVEAQMNVAQRWIDLLDVRLQLVEKMTEVVYEGMLEMTSKEPR